LNKLLVDLSGDKLLEEKVRNLLQIIYAELRKDYSFMPDGYEKGKKASLENCKHALKQLLLRKKINIETVSSVRKMFKKYFKYFNKAQIAFIDNEDEWFYEYYYGRNIVFAIYAYELNEILKEVKDGEFSGKRKVI